MCTVTWWRTGEGVYGVLFNRDEQRARPRSLPVAAFSDPGGTDFVCARDGAAGGTWLMGNAHGVCVGVLNHYEAAGVLPPGERSRGELPLLFAAARSVDDVEDRLPRLSPERYAPFVLVAWDGLKERCWQWDGRAFARRAPTSAILTTSSVRSSEVVAWRERRYAESAAEGGTERAGAAGVEAPEWLERFHTDTAHADGAFNVLMARGDARTESVCCIVVDSASVRYRHSRRPADPALADETFEAMVARS
jgi:hypothetical protein